MKTKLVRQKFLDAADRVRNRVSKMTPAEQEVLREQTKQMLQKRYGFLQ